MYAWYSLNIENISKELKEVETKILETEIAFLERKKTQRALTTKMTTPWSTQLGVMIGKSEEFSWTKKDTRMHMRGFASTHMIEKAFKGSLVGLYGEQV